MTSAIVKWLGGNDTGSSSKTIALTALGEMPDGATYQYPHDGDDFGRCYRLLQAAPEAKAGLDRLAKDGGAYWAALAARWDEIEAAHLRNLTPPTTGAVSALMRSILRPLQDQDGRIVRLGDGASMVFPAAFTRGR